MAKVLVAAWGGLMVGWVGFGWALSQAPADMHGRMRAEIPVAETRLG